MLTNYNTISWTWNRDLYDTTGAEAPAFCHLIRTDNSLKMFLMPGKIEGRRIREHQRMRWLDRSLIQWTWTWANSGRWWGGGRPGLLQSTGPQRAGHSWATEQQQPDTTRLKPSISYHHFHTDSSVSVCRCVMFVVCVQCYPLYRFV